MTQYPAPIGAQTLSLDALATEARVYSESMAMNMFQLGRVYTEAKKLVPHGQWQEWVRQNGGMSERSAQQLMQIYARFGALPAFSGVDKSKLIKMLSLPSGTEEEFLEEHDVDTLSSREVDEEVKRVREEAQAEIDRERSAREVAETRARELEDAPPRIPDDIAETLANKDADMQDLRSEIERLTNLSKELMAENKSIPQITSDLQEAEELLREKQGEYNRLQEQLLNAESAIAKGDAERTPADELTLDGFAAAARQFVGTCARLPHMARSFAKMDPDTLDAFDTVLKTVEGWTRDARTALDTITAEVIEP